MDDVEEGDEKEEKRQLRERRMKKRSKDGDGLLRLLVVPLPEQLVATFTGGIGIDWLGRGCCRCRQCGSELVPRRATLIVVMKCVC